MSRVVAIGEAARVEAYALAGVQVLPVDDERGALEAWTGLPPDTGVLILAPEAARALAARLERRPRLLWVVLPA